MSTQATLFSLVYGVEAVLHVEFDIASFRVAIDTRLIESSSLKHRLLTLKAMDESERQSAQYIEIIHGADKNYLTRSTKNVFYYRECGYCYKMQGKRITQVNSIRCG